MMKITTAEGAPLMEVAEVRIDKGRIVFEGKIMGGIPMKAYVPPQQFWVLMKMIWFKKALVIAGLLIRAVFTSK